jgi:hypothetical protein
MVRTIVFNPSRTSDVIGSGDRGLPSAPITMSLYSPSVRFELRNAPVDESTMTVSIDPSETDHICTAATSLNLDGSQGILTVPSIVVSVNASAGKEQ